MVNFFSFAGNEVNNTEHFENTSNAILTKITSQLHACREKCSTLRAYMEKEEILARERSKREKMENEAAVEKKFLKERELCLFCLNKGLVPILFFNVPEFLRIWYNCPTTKKKSSLLKPFLRVYFASYYP